MTVQHGRCEVSHRCTPTPYARPDAVGAKQPTEATNGLCSILENGAKNLDCWTARFQNVSSVQKIWTAGLRAVEIAAGVAKNVDCWTETVQSSVCESPRKKSRPIQRAEKINNRG